MIINGPAKQNFVDRNLARQASLPPEDYFESDFSFSSPCVTFSKLRHFVMTYPILLEPQLIEMETGYWK